MVPSIYTLYFVVSLHGYYGYPALQRCCLVTGTLRSSCASYAGAEPTSGNTAEAVVVGRVGDGFGQQDWYVCSLSSEMKK